jgi:23S rRNA (uridine2479-2'-O)-methyltransferase
VIRTRDARFQQWRALLDNRAKRQRSRSFLVQGVDPINAALRQGWQVRAFLHAGAAGSAWARGLLDGPVAAERVQVAPPLLAELGQRDDGPPELLAVVAMPADDLERIGAGRGPVVVVDRPANPGNLGSLIRSADALGAAGLVVVGHATDLYDPRTVRASRGSLFALPCVRVGSPAEVLAWLPRRRPSPVLVGATEDGELDAWDHDFTAPTVLVVGNEATGLSRAWVEACDVTVRIPMVGSASSLNAAVSGSVLLYEAFRQRTRASSVVTVGERGPVQ